MARRFNGSSDFIVFTLSSVLQSLDAGPLTMAVLASITSTTDGALIHARTSGGTNSWWMETFSAQWNYGQGVAARDIGDLTTSEGWAVYAGHKGNGGAAVPVGRKVILGGSTTEVTAPSALADGTAPGAGGILQMGKWGTASEFAGFDGACAAIWDYELSQAEIDALATSFANWSTTSTPPKWLVKFTQANPGDAISDETGNGGGSSSITGTTIVSDPSGFFSSAGATPNGIAVPVALGTPTAALGLSATPAGIAVPVVPGSPASAILSASPAGIALAAALGVPTVALNLATAPDGVAVPIAVGQPSVVVSTPAPAGIALAVVLGQPAVALNPAAPAGIAVTTALGQPASAYTATTQPSGIAVPVAAGTPGEVVDPAPGVLVASGTSTTLTVAGTAGAALAAGGTSAVLTASGTP